MTQWPLPSDHPYALSEEERQALERTEWWADPIVGAGRECIAASLMERGLLEDVRDSVGEVRWHDPARLTDAGRQVLALYAAMESCE